MLKAEKEAHEIVSKARKYRQEKLKQAKSDAAKEIEAYKVQKDKDLKEIESKNEGGVGKLEEDAASTVEGDLKEIEQVVAKKQQDIVKLLVEAVIKPTAEMHVNA